MDRARYAVDAVVLEGRSLRSVASSLDMSKSWVAKQVVRFHAGGDEALEPRSNAAEGAGQPTCGRGRRRDRGLWGKRLAEDGLDAGAR